MTVLTSSARRLQPGCQRAVPSSNDKVLKPVGQLPAVFPLHITLKYICHTTVNKVAAAQASTDGDYFEFASNTFCVAEKLRICTVSA